MALSAFDDRAAGPPDEDALATVLGESFGSWTDLRRDLAAELGPLTEEWGFTSRSTGWGLRLRQPHRVLVYLTPCSGWFRASFVLGERAVAAARASDLPRAVLDGIEGSKKYAEGRGVRLEVRTAADVAAVRTLAAIKHAH